MVKVFKTSYVIPAKTSRAPEFLRQLFCPELVLFTTYHSDADLGKPVHPSGHGTRMIRLDTGIGTNYIEGEPHRHVYAKTEVEEANIKYGQDPSKYKGELAQDHAQRCLELERQFGHGVEQIVNSYPIAEGFVTSVSHAEETVALETKFRAPRYFLPDGFPINGEELFDVKVCSAAKRTSSGFDRSSGVFTPDGTAIHVQDPNGIKQILGGHSRSIQDFVGMLKRYYFGKERSYRAEGLLEDRAYVLSHVDLWDWREIQLLESARMVARTILEDSPLREQVKEVILYGSLARKDKLPGDIDLMLIVDPRDRRLNPLNYFKVDDTGRPKEYNVADVTNGIAKELGIVPALLKIGTKRVDRSGFGVPDEAENIRFSDTGGGINLSVIPVQFLRNPTLREQYMRLCFTPTYFHDVLTDGLAFDTQEREFAIDTRTAFAEVIKSLKEQHGKAVIENWPNAHNVKPEKIP